MERKAEKNRRPWDSHVTVFHEVSKESLREDIHPILNLSPSVADNRTHNTVFDLAMTSIPMTAAISCTEQTLCLEKKKSSGSSLCTK